MDLLNRTGGTAFFLGTNNETIQKIRERARKEYPNVRTAGFAPPYKKEVSEADTLQMVAAMERHRPDILWIGLGAPKQEKWAAENLHRLPVKGWIGCIGAVFDFYSGHIARAPWVWQKYHSEWLHRFLHDPRRLWKRYLLGNAKFIGNVLRERGER
jgi:N-acetylglucosaminyldiphosphoundecaprenol N-acetyl-beta-D-mannosaminyltransferase